MEPVVDLEHVRRAQRLCPILVDRFGASFFVKDAAAGILDELRLARCADLACDWIGRRSGRAVDEEGKARIARLVRALVLERLVEGSVRVR